MELKTCQNPIAFEFDFEAGGINSWVYGCQDFSRFFNSFSLQISEILAYGCFCLPLIITYNHCSEGQQSLGLRFWSCSSEEPSIAVKSYAQQIHADVTNCDHQ